MTNENWTGVYLLLSASLLASFVEPSVPAGLVLLSMVFAGMHKL